jgi:hypothetical protein
MKNHYKVIIKWLRVQNYGFPTYSMNALICIVRTILKGRLSDGK